MKKHRPSLWIYCLLTLPLGLAERAAGEDRRPPASFLLKSAGLAEIARVEMPGIDVAALEAEDARRLSLRGGPQRFAAPIEVDYTLATSGTREVLADGSRLWRLRIASPGALHLNLGILRFDLPPWAALWIYDPAGERVEGPYTAGHRTEAGELWTPIVEGDEVVVEVHVPAGAAEPAVEIGRVNHGYRFFGRKADKQGACQNDVVCPVGDAWRDQIRAVAWYSVEGIGACTGTLVNSRDPDQPPYFLSAEHCEITRNNAGSMVIYWNYDSPTCGRLSGGNLADSQTGAIFRAAYRPSDFVLVELRQKPPARFDVHYAGWNASGEVPSRVVGVHHPNLDEKAISFENQRLLHDGSTHWEVRAWDDGTTEPGSSGSCIFDASGLCVGTLTGGYSECGGPAGPDFYGKMDAHWTGGGSRATRLKDWLDPAGTGQRTLAGSDPIGAGGGGNPGGGDPGGGGTGGGGTGGGGTGGGGTGGGGAGVCSDSHVLCLGGGRFEVTLDWTTADGQQGRARKAPAGSADSGLFWFFSPDNWEMLVKVLDACGVNQHKWVFAAATTDVAYTLRVRDTARGQVRTYSNPQGRASPAITDTTAFATCP